MRKIIINKGDKFGKLTAIKFDYKKYGHQYWIFKCECGNIKTMRLCQVKSGKTKSCGCLNIGNYKHGMSKSKIWMLWQGIKKRCFDKKHISYHRYGGREITVCKRWLGERGFQHFYEDMGNRPKGKSLDRKNNDGNYNKNNCRWATYKEQSNNK